MPEPTPDRPLVVGAGPVGLAAALFLARHGIAVRLIDQAAERPSWSRALAVNPRTLRLLRPTGVADEIERVGQPIRGAHIWMEGKSLARFDFAEVNGRRPHLVALSQAVSERLIRDAYTSLGGVVEMGTGLTDCRLTADGPLVTLTADGQPHRPPWVFAADGAHSVTRHAVGQSMKGDQLHTPWNLVDVPLDTPAEIDRAHIFFLKGGGFLFGLPVITDTATSAAGPVWRLMGNVPDPLARLAVGRPLGEPVWASSFRIAHRQITRQAVGPIYFGGDAAHLHSPVGARGMNLGIEDAWVFAECLADGRPERYGPLRHRVDGRVVRRIRQVTRVVIGESAVSRGLRRLMPTAVKTGLVRRMMTRMLTGLDHPITPEPR